MAETRTHSTEAYPIRNNRVDDWWEWFRTRCERKEPADGRRCRHCERVLEQ